MLKLRNLKFNNIGRFLEPQVIDFQGLKNLVQVDAQNLNTQGSSGSGKSTIFNALDWLLGLSSLPTTVLQSRLTKDHMAVEAEFDWDSKTVIIKRSKKLTISIDGIETSGSNKIVEEKLDEIIGMPRDLFALMLHRKQGQSGFFLSLGPSKTFEFLTDVLGLTPISDKIGLIDQKFKELVQLKDKDANASESIKSTLKAIQEAIKTAGDVPITDVTQKIVDYCKELCEVHEKLLNNKKLEYKEQKSALEARKPHLSQVFFDRTDLNHLELENKTITEKINNLLNIEKDRQTLANNELKVFKINSLNQISNLELEFTKKISEIDAKLSELNGFIQIGKESKDQAINIGMQIKTLSKGICHTCEQTWITDKSKKELSRLNESLELLKTNMARAQKATEEKYSLECTKHTLSEEHLVQSKNLTNQNDEKLKDLEKEANPRNVDISDFKNKLVEVNDKKLLEQNKEKEHQLNQNKAQNNVMEAFLLEQQTLISKYETELENFTSLFNSHKNSYEQNKAALESWENSVKKHQNMLEAFYSKEKEASLSLVHMNQKIADAENQINLSEEVKKCLKSYLSCSFDDALISIGDNATNILRSVPTMVNSTIRLEGTKETADGAIKEQVTALLDNDGEIDIPIKSLSGGEKSAVDMALDLTVCQMIQEKANKGIDIMELDEIFNGFDSAGIENALEMLKNFAIDKKILIVEHDGIAKEFVQDRITVVRDGEKSYIKES